MRKQIVLISCVSQKQDTRCMAKDLYVSALFKKSWAYANKLKPDNIFILSAKHHLLEPETSIKPYNLTLNNFCAAERKAWAQEVLKEMKEKELDLENNYYQYLIGEDGIKKYTLPLYGKGGIGCILKYLTEQNR